LPLGLRETRLYARQLALPTVGSVGQERLLAARVAVIEDDTATAAVAAAVAYLEAAGVGAVVLRQAPAAPTGWAAALAGVDVAIRFSLDEDGFLPAALTADRPVIVGRVRGGAVDVLALRRHEPCGHPRVPGPIASAERDAAPGAAAVVLGTLVATECLWMLIDPSRGPRAQLLRLPVDGSEPTATEIPWPPACPVCAASGSKKFLS
jgi:plasmid stabilization system protein ParE